MKDQAINGVDDVMELSVTEPSGSEYGQIHIYDSVIAIIAHETAKTVPGVVELQGSLADDLAGIIGKKSKDKGILVEKEKEDLLTINLAVVLEYGVRIPDICVQLQSAVKQAVEEMTGQSVYHVNVMVKGVRNPSEKKTED